MSDLISWKAETIIYKYNGFFDYTYLLKKGEIKILSENERKISFVNTN
ncbi:MAG: hypothetical protein HN480_02845 [Gammaproteobacteria bacterium]|jgi:hypothetical protein|nr:hypothetical protein [Gammaproteobacteria bacterium]